MSLDRRSFFALAGIGAVGATAASLGLSGCTTPLDSDPVTEDDLKLATFTDISFTDSCDVLVIGSGIAGLSAAIAAREAGAQVIVAEKDALLGGDSFEQTAVLRGLGSAWQQKAGLSETPDQLWKERLKSLKDDGITNPATLELQEAVFRASVDWIDHVQNSYHVQFYEPHQTISLGGAPHVIVPHSGVGDMSSVMEPIRDRLAEIGVVFRAGITATFFILDQTQAVAGMRLFASETASNIDIKAKRVIIATGGYIANQSMVQKYLPTQKGIAPLSRLADGSFITIANRMGLSTDAMDKPCQVIGDVADADAWGQLGPMIAVNQSGVRFAAEDVLGACALSCHTNLSGYWWTIFDSTLSQGVLASSVAKASKDKADQMVGPAQTVEELASMIGVDSQALSDTFATWDNIVSEGQDPYFGRVAGLGTLTPPYFALKQMPRRRITQGGLVVNEKAQILTSMNKPLPHAYAAGNVVAHPNWDFLTQAGFGMVAGRYAAESLSEEDYLTDDANAPTEGNTTGEPTS